MRNILIFLFILIFSLVIFIYYFYYAEDFTKRNTHRQTVAICIYGILRSTKYCYNNIQDRVINELKKLYNVKIYACVYDEYDIENKEALLTLNPDKVSYLDQIRFDLNFKPRLNKIKALQPDSRFNNNYKSTTNYMRALNSLKCVSKLIEEDITLREHPDYVVLIRPDQIYHDYLTFDNKMRENEILTPTWGTNGGTNDRIIFGKFNVMKLIMNRLDLVEDYLEKKPFHAESFLKFVLEYYDLTSKPLNMRASRVREDCSPHRMDEVYGFKDLYKKDIPQKLYL